MLRKKKYNILVFKELLGSTESKTILFFKEKLQKHIQQVNITNIESLIKSLKTIKRVPDSPLYFEKFEDIFGFDE